MKTLIGTESAAAILGVTATRVRQLVAEGKLGLAAVAGSGHRLIDPAVLDAFKRQRVAEKAAKAAKRRTAVYADRVCCRDCGSCLTSELETCSTCLDALGTHRSVCSCSGRPPTEPYVRGRRPVRSA